MGLIRKLIKANALRTVVDSSTIIVLAYVTTEFKRSSLIRLVHSFQRTDRDTNTRSFLTSEKEEAVNDLREGLYC
jgi:hypothetical protein